MLYARRKPHVSYRKRPARGRQVSEYAIRFLRETDAARKKTTVMTMQEEGVDLHLDDFGRQPAVFPLRICTSKRGALQRIHGLYMCYVGNFTSGDNKE